MIDDRESMTSSESARQWVHIGSGLFALLLRFLAWWQAAVLAIVALAFNALLLPRIGGVRLFRPIDRVRGFPIGILLYPLSVLILILAFPDRPDIVAASWGVMAFGDGFATLAGQRARAKGLASARVGAATGQKAGAASTSRSGTRFAHATIASNVNVGIAAARLPWNDDKTVAGTAAFVLFGSAAGVALAWWTRSAVTPPPPLAFTIGAPIIAACVAAFVETIPVRLDDNISVPLSSAAVLWLASAMTAAAVIASRNQVAAQLPWAIAVNGVVSVLGYRARTVSLSGMIGGALIGLVIYAAGGWRAWALLFITFFAAAIASRFGLERKALLGIAEERGGRRGAGNAFANCGVAAVAALAAIVTPFPDRAWLAFVAALCAGGSDTVASEIGKAWGGATFLLTSLGRVRPGTPGAMSLEGTAAGVVSALALAAIGVALGLIPSSAVLAVVVAASAGALIESALAATLESGGILNNDMLNFINTAAAAALVLALT